jgi:pimeloyl-ACP methyl ester carboxylesterase
VPASALLAASACAAVTLAIAAAGATGAQAEIAWTPCGDSNDYACGHLTVPLDEGGAAPGQITLAMRRHRAPVGETSEAVIALAGGPGQAALPFTEAFTHLLGPILNTRDLVVFDQRGIGLSHPLSCHRFEVGGSGLVGRQIAECASQLGPERAYYTTAQTVADIEAIRQAGGYQKLVLYGTSYGTKVAERYAQTYPEHVSGLVLDSVVPPNGPEPLNLPTFKAIPRVLRQLCEKRVCRHITPEPVTDLDRLVRHMHGGSIGGRWIDRNGRPHTLRFSASTLLNVMIAGDLEPVLRAELPAAMRSAANGDTAPFARLLANAGERGEGAEEESAAESFDTPLYFATSCEEELFPWNRASDPAERLAEARARLASLPNGTIAPFGPAEALSIGDMQACAFWPNDAPDPTPVQAPFPSVPTLIFSGADDLRTPTANAREVAAQIPGSHLIVVPEVGHSVLGTDLSGCATRALQALFKSAPIEPCRGGRQVLSLLKLAPLAPPQIADVPVAHRSRGLPGRTLTAVGMTLADLGRHETIQVLTALASGETIGPGSLRVGGLRAGWAELERGELVLHGYSYVPGVTVSGTITATGEVALSVGGAAAARGRLRIADHRLTGLLGGRAVPSSPASILASDAGGIDTLKVYAQTGLKHGSGGSATSARVRVLARLLQRLP